MNPMIVFTVAILTAATMALDVKQVFQTEKFSTKCHDDIWCEL